MKICTTNKPTGNNEERDWSFR